MYTIKKMKTRHRLMLTSFKATGKKFFVSTLTSFSRRRHPHPPFSCSKMIVPSGVYRMRRSFSTLLSCGDPKNPLFPPYKNRVLVVE